MSACHFPVVCSFLVCCLPGFLERAIMSTAISLGEKGLRYVVGELGDVCLQPLASSFVMGYVTCRRQN